MLNKNNILAAILAFSAMLIISCGGGGGSALTGNIGQGGPDTSPEQTTDTSTAATDTVNTDLTGTTTDAEGTVVETAVDIKLEGSLDTSTGDTGLSDAEAILDGAVSTVSTDTTSGDTGSTSGTASSEETASTGTTVTSSDIGGTTSGSGTTVSGTSTSDNTTSDTATTSGSETAVTGTSTSDNTTSNTATTSGSDGSSTAVSSGIPVLSGDIIDALDDDEAVSQTGLVYEIDSSQGRWFKETETELFSEQGAKAYKDEIEALRNEIKSILVSYKNGKVDKETGKGKIKKLRERIAELRTKTGNGGRVQTGIYTNWANENLYLNIKSGEPGWYRIIIVAKNRGKLPNDYSRFTFNVNDSSNETVAGISVKSSDNVYYSGSADVKLDNPSGTKLNLLWTNDAYMKDRYDANINIKKIVLVKIKEPAQVTVNTKHFSGDEFSFMDGRWFFENKDAYTFWSDQVIGYTFKNMEEGVYEVTITAKNYDSLPLSKSYKAFNVEIDSDYDSATMDIKAADKNWNSESVTMNFAEGNTTLYITWTNESYKENEYDANFMIHSIQVKKVNKSSLTAFLLRTKPGNKVFILGAFLILSGLVFGIYLKNKNTREA